MRIQFRFWKWILAIDYVHTSDTVVYKGLIFIKCISFKNNMITQNDHIIYFDWLVMQEIIMFYMENIELAIFFLTLLNYHHIITSIQTQTFLIETSKKNGCLLIFWVLYSFQFSFNCLSCLKCLIIKRRNKVLLWKNIISLEI